MDFQYQDLDALSLVPCVVIYIYGTGCKILPPSFPISTLVCTDESNARYAKRVPKQTGPCTGGQHLSVTARQESEFLLKSGPVQSQPQKRGNCA